MNISKVHTDNRGQVFRFDVGEKTHLLVTFEPGISRGGHYHQAGQWHIVLAGKFNVKLYYINTSEEVELCLVEGDSLFIEPEVAHLFTAIGFSVLCESRIGEPEATDYEPYRKLARPK